MVQSANTYLYTRVFIPACLLVIYPSLFSGIKKTLSRNTECLRIGFVIEVVGIEALVYFFELFFFEIVFKGT